MVKNGQKWSKIVKMVKNGPKWSTMVQNDPKLSEIVKMVKNGPKWSTWSIMVKNGGPDLKLARYTGLSARGREGRSPGARRASS